MNCTCEEILGRNVQLTNLLIKSYRFMTKTLYLYGDDLKDAQALADEIASLEFWDKDYVKNFKWAGVKEKK